MANTQTPATAPAVQAGTGVSTTVQLKKILEGNSMQKLLSDTLGKSSGTFATSLIELTSNDNMLQQCNASAIAKEAMRAATLQLPLNKSLGFAYVIAYKSNGQYMPSFQLGYKGYIQLAMRTGQYKTINADVVYEGELRAINKLSGEISLDGERVSDTVIGYFCHFELLNGFAKTLYVPVERMVKHAKKYSKGLYNKSLEDITAWSKMPYDNDKSGAVGWAGNFHAMGIKTVIRMLLGKYGILSVEMRDAMSQDEVSDENAGSEEAVAVEIVDTNEANFTPVDATPAY